MEWRLRGNKSKSVTLSEESQQSRDDESKGTVIPLVLLDCLAHPSTPLRCAQDDAGMGGMDLKVDKKRAVTLSEESQQSRDDESKGDGHSLSPFGLPSSSFDSAPLRSG